MVSDHQSTPLKQLLFLFGLMAALLLPGSCRLFTPSAAQSPIICFTFDDQHKGVYTNALPVMAQYGYRGTCFVNTNSLGKPNSLNLNQLQELYHTWHWEIGGHTLNHEQLPQLEYAEAETAITLDYQNLVSWNLSPRSFALPRGECPASYFPIITSLYQNIRGSSDFAMFCPLNRLSLGYLPFQTDWTADIVMERIRRGIANSESLIIIGFHSVGDSIPDYPANCTTAQFAQIMAGTNNLGLKVLPLAEAVECLDK